MRLAREESQPEKEATMNYDPSQTATRDLRLCVACLYETRPQDRFCRRCGAKLDGSPTGEVGSSAQRQFHSVSGALVAAVAEGVNSNTGQIHSPLARRLISALISLPIWLIIILLSLIDAYVTARIVANQA